MTQTGLPAIVAGSSASAGLLTTRGGGYCFVPDVRALRWIAEAGTRGRTLRRGATGGKARASVSSDGVKGAKAYFTQV